MTKLIAVTLVIAHVQGQRIQFKPGEEVTGLSAHDAAALLRLGSVRDLQAEEVQADDEAQQRAAAQAEFEKTRAGLKAAQDSVKPPDPVADAPAGDVPQAEMPPDAEPAAVQGTSTKPPKAAKPKA